MLLVHMDEPAKRRTCCVCKRRRVPHHGREFIDAKWRCLDCLQMLFGEYTLGATEDDERPS